MLATTWSIALLTKSCSVPVRAVSLHFVVPHPTAKRAHMLPIKHFISTNFLQTKLPCIFSNRSAGSLTILGNVVKGNSDTFQGRNSSCFATNLSILAKLGKDGVQDCCSCSTDRFGSKLLSYHQADGNPVHLLNLFFHDFRVPLTLYSCTEDKTVRKGRKGTKVAEGTTYTSPLHEVAFFSLHPLR